MRVNTPAEILPEAYDIYVNGFTKEWNQYLINRIIEEIEVINITTGKLLDIGTGTGRTLIDLSGRKEVNGLELYGVDYFENMVEKAKENVKKSEKKIEIKQGDAHDLPYEDNTFDMIIGRSVIHHWADPVKAYQEIFRVMKRGAVGIIHEPSSQPTEKAKKIFNEQRAKCGMHPLILRDKFSPKEIEQQFKSVGLQDNVKVLKGEGLYSIGYEVLMKK